MRSVITSQTLEGLASAVDSRLAEIENRTGNFRLDADFTSNLKDTIARFNEFAKTGIDLDFHRGEFPADDPPVPADLRSEYPNPAMYPIASTGPYYAVLIAGGTLDTKGGPKINTHGQVLDTQGQAIPGLYGAGNCRVSRWRGLLEPRGDHWARDDIRRDRRQARRQGIRESRCLTGSGQRSRLTVDSFMYVSGRNRLCRIRT